MASPVAIMRRRTFSPSLRERDLAMDERSRRIRAAEEAGFLVVRSRTIEFPDGRRMRTYSPYQGDEGDED